MKKTLFFAIFLVSAVAIILNLGACDLIEGSEPKKTTSNTTLVTTEAKVTTASSTVASTAEATSASTTAASTSTATTATRPAITTTATIITTAKATTSATTRTAITTATTVTTHPTATATTAPAATQHNYVPAGLTLPTVNSIGFTSGKICSHCGDRISSGNTYPALSEACGDHAYNSLSSVANGEKIRAFYRSLFDACTEFHESTESAQQSGSKWIAVKIPYNSFGINANESFAALRAIQADCPIFYWVNGYASADGTYLTVETNSEYKDGSVRKNYAKAISEELVAIYMTGEHTYERALRLHDRIVVSMDYAYKSDGVTPETDSYSHNILGYLTKDRGVCESFAKIYQLFLNYCGHENIIVNGTANGGGHTWNLVRMDDGSWYWFDLTWNDQPGLTTGRQYAYFCKTDSEFKLSERSTAATQYPLPARSASSYSGSVPLVDSRFKIGNATYMVMGYRQVELINEASSGRAVIPASVMQGGIRFDVASVGYLNNGSLTPVFEGSVTDVEIPSSVMYIRGNAFSTYSIRSVSVNSSNPYFFSEGAAIYRKSPCTLVCYLLTANAESYTLNANAVGIESWAVVFNNNLRTLVLPKGIKSIKANAVYNCGKLSAIEYGGKKSEWAAIALGSNAIPAVTVKCTDGNY